jgi:hypothetical protein
MTEQEGLLPSRELPLQKKIKLTYTETREFNQQNRKPNT